MLSNYSSFAPSLPLGCSNNQTGLHDIYPFPSLANDKRDDYYYVSLIAGLGTQLPTTPYEQCTGPKAGWHRKAERRRPKDRVRRCCKRTMR